MGHKSKDLYAHCLSHTRTTTINLGKIMITSMEELFTSNKLQEKLCPFTWECGMVVSLFIYSFIFEHFEAML